MDFAEVPAVVLVVVLVIVLAAVPPVVPPAVSSVVVPVVVSVVAMVEYSVQRLDRIQHIFSLLHIPVAGCTDISPFLHMLLHFPILFAHLLTYQLPAQRNYIDHLRQRSQNDKNNNSFLKTDYSSPSPVVSLYFS